MKNNKCSDLFEKVFSSHHGGCLIECVCGRINFDSSDNGWTWEKGELEDLQNKAKSNPDKYIEHYGTVASMMISGNEVVYDCPCENAKKSEDFILNNAEKISQYLNEKAKLLREKAQEIEVHNEK